jgi:pyruvate,water dikinase
MPDLILPFGNIRDASLPEVGAKALSLARMARLGLPVPPGFCVTLAAYRGHLADHDLNPLVKETIAAARLAGPAEKSRLLASLREAITTAVLPVEFRNLVEQAFRKLDARRVAVRSSSTVEDLPGLSFAGLYDTTLLKGDVWGCLDAVKKCWASLWTDRAFDYREKNRIDHTNAGMCVIVQKMVSAETSGVIFTADPVSGAPDLIVIEASFGLGEGIVSGKVTPDRFVLVRDKLRVVERAINRKTIQMVFTEQWGVREWPVEDERQEQPALDDALALRLGKLALATEQAFGRPQDIEWAQKDNELCLLQARPITTLPGAQAREERTVWTNVNVGEALPEAAPPLTLSLGSRFVDDLFNYIARLAGVRLGDIPLLGIIAGRPYLNINVFIALIRGIPIVNRMKLSELFGGLSESLIPKPADTPEIKVNRWKLPVSLPWLVFWFLRSQPKSGYKGLARLKEQTDALQQTDFGKLSDTELAAQAYHGIDQVLGWANDLGGAMTGMQYYSMLFNACRRWFGDGGTDDQHQGESIASKLLMGLGTVNSAQAGLELWRLAEVAGARPELKALVLSPEPWVSLRPKLAGVELGEEFLARWDQLMFLNGHHCRGEFDVSKPRWRELPDFVLDAVRGFIRAAGALDPEQEQRQRAAEREQLASECRRRLRNPFKKLMFGFLLKQAQAGASIRENVRDDVNRRVAIARMAMLELGTRLAQRGTIAERDDIFFLTQPELVPVIQGNQVFDIRNTIADRRAEFQRDQGITPPPVIVGRYQPDEHPPEPIDENAETLSGLAVSPGIVTGPARVILSYSHNEQVLPGEILVAPFTDPGWTPYFLPAAAIVVDIGGMLSHGSIVAREYGKPAVVNVGPATKIIKTGQMIQVDGNQGKVRILR